MTHITLNISNTKPLQTEPSASPNILRISFRLPLLPRFRSEEQLEKCRLARLDRLSGSGSLGMTRGFVGRCLPSAKLRARWMWLTSRPTDGRLTAFLIDDRYWTLRRHAYPIHDLHLRPPSREPVRSGERRKAARFASVPRSRLHPDLFCTNPRLEFAAR